MRTATGLKDNMLEFYMGRIWVALRGARGSREAKQNVVETLLATFPADVTSPVWRIRGLSTFFLRSLHVTDFLKGWILTQIPRWKSSTSFCSAL